MYEQRSAAPLSRSQFAWRLARHLGVSAGIVGAVLLIGIWGYEHYEGLHSADAFLNAAMILGGMGPIYTRFHDAGKIFAGVYALLSGLVFVAVVSIMITPVVHRILHRFHWSVED
jgi:hypothetical protein